MDTIVFYHEHVNGDCYTSRAFVNHVIKHTNKKYKYYYTARSSLISHCKDIGISDENFNVIEVPSSNNIVFNIGESVFINLWISNVPCDVCLWCLTNVHELYNKILIPKLNKILNTNIPFMDTSKSLYLPFDFSFYDVKQIDSYILKQKLKYKKVCSVFNVPTTTYIYCNMINYNILINDLAKDNTDTLFMTFCKTNINRENVVNFTDCFQTTVGYGIEYAYLCSMVDKVIGLPSGVSQMSWIFKEKQPENKFCIIYYIIPDEHIPKKYRCVCNELTEFLCDKKIQTSIYKIQLNDNIYNTIHKFLLI